MGWKLSDSIQCICFVEVVVFIISVFLENNKSIHFSMKFIICTYNTIYYSVSSLSIQLTTVDKMYKNKQMWTQ